MKSSEGDARRRSAVDGKKNWPGGGWKMKSVAAWKMNRGNSDFGVIGFQAFGYSWDNFSYGKCRSPSTDLIGRLMS